MKKIFKIFSYLILVLLLFVLILAVAASFSQKRIVDFALKEISESVQIPIEIEDLSFTFIKRFPFATIELSGVKIGAVDSMHTNFGGQSGEDILTVKNVFVSVKTMPLLNGEFEIIMIEIDDAALNYKVDSSGVSNISVLWNTNANNTSVTDTSGTIPTLNLKKVKLKNTAIFYIDNKTGASANLFFPNIEFEGKFANKNFDGTIEGEMQLAKCNYSGTNIYRMEEADFNFNLEYESDTLRIKSFESNTDGAQFEITGKAAFMNVIYTDLTIESDKLELGKLVKYLPDSIPEKYEIENFGGILNLSGSLKGVVSDSVIPAIDVTFDLKNGFIQTKNYPIVRKLDCAGKFSNGSQRNNKTTTVNLNSLRAETDSSMVDLLLTLSNLDKPKYTINSKLNINIEEFKELIPDTIIQSVSGKITGTFATTGQMPDSIDDNFINFVANNSTANLDFSNLNMELDSLTISDLTGSVIYNPGQLAISNLNVLIPEYNLNLTNSSVDADFTGLLTQYQNLAVHLKSFNLESPQGKIQGSANIKNLKHPDFVLDANANLNLAEIEPFLPDSLIKSISGNLYAKLNTYGKLNLDSVSEQLTDIVFKQSKLMFDAKNISLTMPDTLQKISNLNGVVTMANDTVFISNMNGIATDIDFSIDSLTIVNAYKSVIKNQRKTVLASGNFQIGAVDYSRLAPLIPAESAENGSNPRNFLFEFKGKIAAKSFKYEKIVLENISAKFNVCDSVYIVDQFKANAFDGSTNSSFRFSVMGDGKQIVNIKNTVSRMDISKFMYAFDNFGYDSLISHENIKGLVSAELNSRLVFNSDTLVKNDMRVMGDLTLENGRIINYQPAMDVSNFTGIKELDNIELKTLKSNIFIFKNQMFVPTTNVVSSSMDFSVFGMQSFGDNYEYHLQMHLGEVLKGKSKKLLERQNSSGDEISKEDLDRNTIKIIYANIDGKAKAGFDNKKAQKAMELKIQVQQKMLNLIFHPKLVSFETGVK